MSVGSIMREYPSGAVVVMMVMTVCVVCTTLPSPVHLAVTTAVNCVNPFVIHSLCYERLAGAARASTTSGSLVALVGPIRRYGHSTGPRPGRPTGGARAWRRLPYSHMFPQPQPQPTVPVGMVTRVRGPGTAGGVQTRRLHLPTPTPTAHVQTLTQVQAQAQPRQPLSTIDNFIVQQPDDYPRSQILAAFYSAPAPPPPSIQPTLTISITNQTSPPQRHRFSSRPGGFQHGTTVQPSILISNGNTRGGQLGGKDTGNEPLGIPQPPRKLPRIEFAPQGNFKPKPRNECAPRCQCDANMVFEDGCTTERTVIKPYSAHNIEGEVRTIVQLPQQALEQELEIVSCSSASGGVCSYGEGSCIQEQCEKPLLVYADGRIFIDNFRYRACCRCEQIDYRIFIQQANKRRRKRK